MEKFPLYQRKDVGIGVTLLVKSAVDGVKTAIFLSGCWTSCFCGVCLRISAYKAAQLDWTFCTFKYIDICLSKH